MDDKEKLTHLVSHWREHNSEHAETYRKWAQKMADAGEGEAERILSEIAVKTEELNGYFLALSGVLA
ncbi:hypothetical protein BMS3Abin07_00582 [bacterium BMS3Abin07]|nr:hypothetical protein BMS3Abin07_00582 [bacterium BMS3Abin07]HDO22354.1 hypothetical protein [Nitrospirota bacterium]HDZ88811.1 hypothetical protein [Nitrospirota bacterium]